MSSSLENTLGAVLLGAVVSTFIAGTTLVQVLVYFQRFPNDGGCYRRVVATLAILDTVHSASVVASSYEYALGCVQRSPLVLLEIPVSAKVQTFIVPILVTAVNIMYTVRLFKFGGLHGTYFARLVGYIIALPLLVGFSLAIYIAVKMTSLTTWESSLPLAWAFETAYGIGTGVDLLVAVAMVCFLRSTQKQQQKCERRRSRLDAQIRVLIQYCLASGTLTSLCSLACVIALITMPNNLIFFALTFISTRLYVASFLTMLNMRPRSCPCPGAAGGLGPGAGTSLNAEFVHTHPPATYAFVQRSLATGGGQTQSRDVDGEGVYTNSKSVRTGDWGTP
ncbi:QCR6 subunit 6 of the ubiquinol cytochrome-c reductase complex [Mycena kentingensis (nom. inval.)]|nr:QCR6 subunit 6 of the ubiquinol cytochrome-c reductase complex [Mycena kentingensis (nom. inval.)]